MSMTLSEVWQWAWGYINTYGLPILIVVVAFLVVLNLIRATVSVFRATPNPLKPPRMVTAGTPPTPVVVGFQHGYFWPYLILFLLMGGGVGYLIYTRHPLMGGAPTPTATSALVPTPQNVRTALEALAKDMSTAEHYAEGKKIVMGISPFTMTTPWERLEEVQRESWHNAATDALAKREKSATFVRIKHVTLLGNNDNTDIVGALAFCEVTVPDGNGGTKNEGRNLPFGPPPMLSGPQSIVDWATNLRNAAKAIVASRRGGSVSPGIGLPPAPDIPSPSMSFPASLPTP